ncbi:MAG: DNA replication/repair protein RecF [Candidatus Aminicenantes bacterium]|nr:DNA replication/repair protein RecF [Candidatus Aminicenantes bacterium]
MIIKNLKISGLRNIQKGGFSFCEAKNLIYGANGAGKTTVLEAIFISGFGKSFLNVRKADMVNYGKMEFFITSAVKNFHGENKISAVYSSAAGTKFSLLLNGKKTNIIELNEYLYPLFFSSSNYNLYIESKPYIRKLIDRFIFGVYALYIHYILGYNKALKQKNYLLKTRRDAAELSSWNQIISETAEKIVGLRMEFVGKLNGEIKSKYDNSLEIKYSPSLGSSGQLSRQDFFYELEGLKEREIKYHKSLKGPHLDNFEIHLNSRNLKFNSSGEKKINLLMVYISYIELFKKEKKEYPIFLVDDFDTAIDANNIEFLMENYPDLQVIATSVNRNSGFDKLIALEKEN